MLLIYPMVQSTKYNNNHLFNLILNIFNLELKLTFLITLFSFYILNQAINACIYRGRFYYSDYCTH